MGVCYDLAETIKPSGDGVRQTIDVEKRKSE
jgi:hypothetical protein